MEQERFEHLTKMLVTERPRRGLFGAIAGGALAVVFGRDVPVAEARDRRRKRKNRCLKVNRICQPFRPGKCCSDRCCPALGPKASTQSVCAPQRASQCCPPEMGGGYCDRPGDRKCCAPTDASPNGFCCPSQGSVCCPANDVSEGKDYCCPTGSTCATPESGLYCVPIEGAQGLGANTVIKPEAAGRKAG